MPKLLAVGVAALALLPAAQPAPSRDDALRSLVETEREFARTAIEKGIRDSFLQFFAPDSLALVPEPRSAVERLRARPSTPFAEAELTWEPRAGDVAAAGDLGWLTGPSTYVDHAAKAGPSHGNYLSIWRRQVDGAWRVYIDVGTTIPGPAQFPAGFTPVRLPRAWVGGGDRRGALSFADAEKTLNARILSTGMAKAYGSAVAPAGSRLHRQQMMPQVGREAIVATLERQNTRWAPRTLGAEIAALGDMAFSYGTYTSGGNRGGYARIWARDASGRWWLMADVATPEQAVGSE